MRFYNDHHILFLWQEKKKDGMYQILQLLDEDCLDKDTDVSLVKGNEEQ